MFISSSVLSANTPKGDPGAGFVHRTHTVMFGLHFPPSVLSTQTQNDLFFLLSGDLQSVGPHDEINWIIAVVGFCSLSEGNYLGYMAVNEWNHWHKACHTPVR